MKKLKILRGIQMVGVNDFRVYYFDLYVDRLIMYENFRYNLVAHKYMTHKNSIFFQ